MSETAVAKFKRPAWLKSIIILFVCYVVLLFGWLGWMVITGEGEGPIPEKYKKVIGICLIIVACGPFVIVGVDLCTRFILKMKKWAEE